MRLSEEVQALKEMFGAPGAASGHSFRGPETGNMWSLGPAFLAWLPQADDDEREPGREREESSWQRRKRLGKTHPLKTSPEE